MQAYNLSQLRKFMDGLEALVFVAYVYAYPWVSLHPSKMIPPALGMGILFATEYLTVS